MTAGLVVAAIWYATSALSPLPPRTVTMATGPDGGAYQEVGKRYQEILARHGITLNLVPTAGALENLALLRDPDSDVGIGLLQGGITNAKESPDLEALGTVFFEPLWFFHRGGAGGNQLRGAAGPEGLDRTRGKRHPGARPPAAGAPAAGPELRSAARAQPSGRRRSAGPR